ncbi:IS110 family transposase, partial [Candidatus Solirubrobacter pratensis]|uniref:IS110 family transposase n=1 Tax=Candidatus Solirubrobacter pratensis TaxID=1298857 RepID=UPI0012DE9F34
MSCPPSRPARARPFSTRDQGEPAWTRSQTTSHPSRSRVDTHLDQHAAAVLDGLGRVLATSSVPATAEGYEQLLSWASAFGLVIRAGVEGTSSYGAGLTRFLQAAGVEVIEVTRAARADRRHLGKSDPVDAQAAARAVLAETATASPKPRDGI